jgi:GNAT superfamily N-acetyltransferase
MIQLKPVTDDDGCLREPEWLARAEAVTGVGLWRRLDKTYSRRELYVDDLVSDERRRSSGIGRALLGWLEAKARELDCDSLCLDSGTQRRDAHRFYFRERMSIASFHFHKAL